MLGLGCVILEVYRLTFGIPRALESRAGCVVTSSHDGTVKVWNRDPPQDSGTEMPGLM